MASDINSVRLMATSAMLGVAIVVASLATEIAGIGPSPLVDGAFADKRIRPAGGATTQNVGRGTASKAGVENAKRLRARNGRDFGGELPRNKTDLPEGRRGDDGLFDRYCEVQSPIGGPSYDYEQHCTANNLGEIKAFCQDHKTCRSAFLCNYSHGTIMVFDCARWRTRGQ